MKRKSARLISRQQRTTLALFIQSDRFRTFNYWLFKSHFDFVATSRKRLVMVHSGRRLLTTPLRHLAFMVAELPAADKDTPYLDWLWEHREEILQFILLILKSFGLI